MSEADSKLVIGVPCAAPSQQIAQLDRPPPGWFVLAVMRKGGRGWDWVALMVDIDPDCLPRHLAGRRECWVTIPGKHKSWEAACKAFRDMVAMRHWIIRQGARLLRLNRIINPRQHLAFHL
jgi:hypothetical protein